MRETKRGPEREAVTPTTHREPLFHCTFLLQHQQRLKLTNPAWRDYSRQMYFSFYLCVCIFLCVFVCNFAFVCAIFHV